MVKIVTDIFPKLGLFGNVKVMKNHSGTDGIIPDNLPTMFKKTVLWQSIFEKQSFSNFNIAPAAMDEPPI